MTQARRIRDHDADLTPPPPATVTLCPAAKRAWPERLAETRVPLWSVGLLTIAGFVAMIGFGALIRHPEDHPALGRVAVQLATIPETLAQFGDEYGAWHPSLRVPYARLPGGLWRNPADRFVDPGFILVTAFDTDLSRYVVRLVRLGDGHVVRTYAPDIAAIDARSTFRSALVDLSRDKTNRRYMPMHPMLMPDGGLILHDGSPLVRVDACGRAEWMIDGIFHHSLEPAGDGTFWASYREPRSAEPGVSPRFIDEGIAHVGGDGRVVRRESIIAILDRNGLGHLWRARPYSDDPIHLNDVQPVPADGPYWRRGDLFLSLRNLSLLLLYRPATGQVIWHRDLPWRFQHDVSVIDDHRISVFDNHWRFAWDQPEQAEPDGNNRMLVYDFTTDRVSDPLARAFHDLGIRTRAQGRATPLPGGDVMVEETEMGRVFRLAPDGHVRWRYISADAQDRRYELRWTRYLDPAVYQGGLHAAETASCR